MAIAFDNSNSLKELNSNIRELAIKYNLSVEEIYDNFKSSFEDVLTDSIGYKTTLDITPSGIFLYGLIEEHGVEKEILLSPHHLKKYHFKLVFDLLAYKLSYAEAASKLEQYKKFINTVINGMLLKQNDEYFTVSITDPLMSNTDGEIDNNVIGLCHKSNLLAEDERYCRNVLPMVFKIIDIRLENIDGVVRLSFILSRSSKDLPVLILKKMFQDVTKDESLFITCRYRDIGKFCSILTNKYIPKRFLHLLNQEFRGENYQINMINKKIINMKELL